MEESYFGAHLMCLKLWNATTMKTRQDKSAVAVIDCDFEQGEMRHKHWTSNDPHLTVIFIVDNVLLPLIRRHVRFCALILDFDEK